MSRSCGVISSPYLVMIEAGCIAVIRRSMLSWLSPVIGVVFFFLSYRFWMYGAMKYSGTGS